MRMGSEPHPSRWRRRAAQARPLLLAAARLAPWVVFGPITGVMSEAAIASFKSGRPARGAFYVALSIAILLALPLATALIVARL